MPGPGRISFAAFALLIGASAAALFWALKSDRGETIRPTAPAPATMPGNAAGAPPPPPSSSAAEPPLPAATENTLPTGDAARNAIEELYVTYDAASVPALARYLKHPDPEIRSAARDGLINLGERAAIPFLEAAAKTAPAEEAKSLREAAEFLALPTWTEQREAQKKAAAGIAIGAP